jgi:hypothetical protein
MTPRLALRLAAALGGLTSAAGALAHEGHGLMGSHWHATDAGVFVGLVLAAAAAIWLGRK